jgi:hypothetical protein
MSLSAGTIATGIAALSVSGVTIKDVTAIPDTVNGRDCPILFPSPDGWLLGGNGEPSDGPTTFGTAITRMWTFNRTYRYVFLYEQAGATRGLKDVISGLAGKVDLITEAVAEMDLTDVDAQSITVSNFGVIEAPDAKAFFGCILDFTFRERLNNG